uniref:Peptidase M12B domain-containing protein n=1 Tax=Amblyomma maculatum TaxID=34609 RepID=G3MR54_AMBMU
MKTVVLNFLVWNALTVPKAECEFNTTTMPVYPQVYESRLDNSEKVLVIHANYSLKLVKASILAGTLILQNITTDGVINKYVNGAYHERYLYEDLSKQASLLLTPREGGHCSVVGLLNFTHRIEPVIGAERSSSGNIPHRILPVNIKNEIDTCEKYDDEAGNEEKNPQIEERASLSSFTLELVAISDYAHNKHFKSEEDRVSYMTMFLHSVSLRLQQLNPPGKIAVIALQASTTEKESYVSFYDDSKLIANETLDKLVRYSLTNPEARRSDAVLLVTGRDLVDLIHGGVSSGAAGMAYFKKACTNMKVLTAEDRLGSYHDGSGNSANCSANDGYLMTPSFLKARDLVFSKCSKRAIGAFVRSASSFCLHYTARVHKMVFPSDTADLPGAVMTGEEYCKKYFPHRPNVTYIKWDSDLLKCKVRCQLDIKSDGKPLYAIRSAMDGIPCNRENKDMKCKNFVCV